MPVQQPAAAQLQPARSPNEQPGRKGEPRELEGELELRPMRSMEIKEAARAMSAVTQVPSELLSSLEKKLKTADYVAL